jgi:hypothetical protein
MPVLAVGKPAGNRLDPYRGRVYAECHGTGACRNPHQRRNLRDVLRLEALLTGKDMGEIVEQLVSANLTASVEQIRARRGHEQPKKGKRPKSDD